MGKYIVYYDFDDNKNYIIVQAKNVDEAKQLFWKNIWQWKRKIQLEVHTCLKDEVFTNHT